MTARPLSALVRYEPHPRALNLPWYWCCTCGPDGATRSDLSYMTRYKAAEAAERHVQSGHEDTR